MNSKFYTRKHVFLGKKNSLNSPEVAFTEFFVEKFSKLPIFVKPTLEEEKASKSLHQIETSFKSENSIINPELDSSIKKFSNEEKSDSIFLLLNFHHISPFVNKKIQSLLYTLDPSLVLQSSKGYQDFFLKKSAKTLSSKKIVLSTKQFSSYEKNSKKKMDSANNDFFFKGQGRFLFFSKDTLKHLEETLNILKNPSLKKYILPLAIYSKGKIYNISCTDQYLLSNIKKTFLFEADNSIVQNKYILNSIINIQKTCILQQQLFLHLLYQYEEMYLLTYNVG